MSFITALRDLVNKRRGDNPNDPLLLTFECLWNHEPRAIGPTNAVPIGTILQYLEERGVDMSYNGFQQGPLKLQNTIHWIKAITIETEDGEVISKGHFKPISSGRFLNDCHEYIFHFSKAGKTPIERLAIGVPYADKTNIARWGHTGGKDVRCRGNTWFIPYKTIRDRNQERPHPATFPVGLAEKCILLQGITPEMVMLDPFLGIGNSAVAAQKIGVRRFIGFDIDADYLGVAAKKLDTVVRESVQQADNFI